MLFCAMQIFAEDRWRQTSRYDISRWGDSRRGEKKNYCAPSRNQTGDLSLMRRGWYHKTIGSARLFGLRCSSIVYWEIIKINFWECTIVFYISQSYDNGFGLGCSVIVYKETIKNGFWGCSIVYYISQTSIKKKWKVYEKWYSHDYQNSEEWDR
jgi:hypothetical protein